MGFGSLEPRVELPVDLPPSDELAASSKLLDEHILRQQASYQIEVPTGVDTLIACGDKRSPTQESANSLSMLHPLALHPMEGYARAWGGPYGIALTFMIADGMSNGRQANFNTTLSAALELTGNQAVAHSDVKSEKGLLDQLNPTLATEGLGCTALMKVGLAIHLLATDEDIQEDVERDLITAFGDADPAEAIFESARMLSAEVKATTHEDTRLFKVSRASLLATVGDPRNVMILKGAHAPGEQTGAIINFDGTTVTSPRLARQSEREYYRIDPVSIGKRLAPFFQETEAATAQEYLYTSVALTTAIRGIIAAKDPTIGVINPARLPFGWHGDPNAGIEELERAIRSS